MNNIFYFEKPTNKNSNIIISLIFLIFAAIVGQYGQFQGQIFAAEIADDNSNAIFLGITFLVLFVLIFLFRKFLTIRIPNKLILGCFALNILLICLLRDDLLNSLRQAIGVLLSLGICLFISILLHSITLELACFSISFSLFVTSMISTYIHVSKVGSLVLFSHTDLYNRLGGLFYYAQFAMILGFSGLISFLCLLIFPKSKYSFFHIINLLLMIVLIFFTDTRSVIFAFIFCIIISAFEYIRRLNLLLKIIVTIFVFSVLLLLLFYISATGTSIISDSDFRLEIWNLAIDGIMKNPIAGYGRTSYLGGLSDAGFLTLGLADPHSSLLDHALKFGIISLALFLWLYFRINFSLIKLRNRFITFITLSIFWIIAPFLWGNMYTISGGLVQFLVVISLIGIIGHPGIRSSQEKFGKRDYDMLIPGFAERPFN